MGNRAVITTRQKKIGVYLHWNGGRDSVEAFLKYCELQGYRCPESDCYGWARFCQIVGNFFGGTDSLGIDDYYKLDRDNYDNGVYIIEKWQIVGREFFKGVEQQEYDLKEMLKAIDEKQPKQMQLGKDFLNAEEVNTSELKIGDKVFMYDYSRYAEFEVVGFGEDRILNGTNVKGLPYVDKYGNDYSENINNYVTTEKIRKVVKK